MNIPTVWRLLCVTGLVLTANFRTVAGTISVPVSPAEIPAGSDIWPRVRQEVGATYTIYQPQIEAWDGNLMTARAAVSVQEGKNEPIYGVITLRTQASVDRDERMVHLDKIEVTGSHFPTLDQINPYLDVFTDLLPTTVPALSLDRIESSLAAASSNAKPKTLRNDPPVILVSDHPTLLVPVDGEPEWAAVADTGIDRLMNTRALLLRSHAGTYFLHLYDGYVAAPSLNGPWTVASRVPAGVTDALEASVKDQQVDLLSGQPDPDTQRMPSLSGNRMPEIHVTTVPTEVIVTNGAPSWSPVRTTQLLSLTNTTSHVFKNLADQTTYVLISGRWFRAPGLSGPWTYAPGHTLPADFAAIPDTSPEENVKASVPGTPQAAEAMIANDIPTTTKISRDAQMSPLPSFDGEPQLGPIEETGLKTVVNSDVPIIEVNRHEWYACQNGVWFASTSVNGPWSVANAIPPQIYSIPPASSLYYLTFVKVYRYDPDFVWLGYTAGYYGAVASDDGTVVYGTGYRYQPYLSTRVWIARPWTYGYGSTLCWTPWGGWGYGFGASFAWDAPWDYWACCPPAPFWGPYWDYCYRFRYEPRGGRLTWGTRGWYSGVASLYSPKGPWSGRIRVTATNLPREPRANGPRYGQAYNSVTGVRIIGATRSLKSVYASPIHTESFPVNAQGSYRAARPAPPVNNRYFAGPDGRVYRREDNGTWHDTAPNRPATVANTRVLDRDYRAREEGQLHSDGFRATPPPPPPTPPPP
jgi:hypothetical protein